LVAGASGTGLARCGGSGRTTPVGSTRGKRPDPRTPLELPLSSGAERFFSWRLRRGIRLQSSRDTAPDKRLSAVETVAEPHMSS
jgi:hypothetical protein